MIPLTKTDLEKSAMIDGTELGGWNDEMSREAIFRDCATYGVGPFWP